MGKPSLFRKAGIADAIFDPRRLTQPHPIRHTEGVYMALESPPSMLSVNCFVICLLVTGKLAGRWKGALQLNNRKHIY